RSPAARMEEHVMMHAKRRWSLSEAASAEALAAMLTGRTWTLCSGFFVKGHADTLFLNAATHADGAGAYAVLRRRADGSLLQVQSITFSWCDVPAALRHIEDALAGAFDAQA